MFSPCGANISVDESSFSLLCYGSKPLVGWGGGHSNELYDVDVHIAMSIMVRSGEVAAY